MEIPLEIRFFELDNGVVVNIEQITDFGKYSIKNDDGEWVEVYLIKKAHKGKSGHPENIRITEEEFNRLRGHIFGITESNEVDE